MTSKAKVPRRALVLVLQALGLVMIFGAIGGGMGLLLFGSKMALGLGAVIGIGLGLTLAMEGEL